MRAGKERVFLQIGKYNYDVSIKDLTQLNTKTKKRRYIRLIGQYFSKLGIIAL